MSTAKLIPTPPLRVSEYERIEHIREVEKHTIRRLSWGLVSLGVFIVSLTVVLIVYVLWM